MKWCEDDCHEKLMWCGRRNCLGREEFKTMMEKKRLEKDGGSKNSSGNSRNSNSKDFKIALAAMVSPEDLETLTSQFLKD